MNNVLIGRGVTILSNLYLRQLALRETQISKMQVLIRWFEMPEGVVVAIRSC
jgi:hypothetical protein